MDAGLGRSGERAHGCARRVADRENDRGRLLLLFFSQFAFAWKSRLLILSGRRLLGRAAFLLFGFQSRFEVIGKRGSKGWIVRKVKRTSLEAFPGSTQGPGRHIEISFTSWKQQCIFVELWFG